MSVQKAKDNYLGKNKRRLNCAQSILDSFREKFNIDEATFNKFSRFGGGGAPNGVCGAYYAAKYILEKTDPEKSKELDVFFIEAAKSLNCKEIRGLKTLSCLGCVEKASQFINNFCF
ncbi:hypothetical protein A2310_06680 [candidate division WOR-1 bacterium RIFOXYB2_FULL_37_13]|uniref:C_GCAxxG_C_C family protein n=1 Tax=candidate division WOR-1 bacterium RIFOXYB2_FULL_37_13 TaxID=1802579 RepID=A0A1F4SX06_UNCSA|nr:MAG: hypothetical protein A2310_06680 [candidate division WOR-1 bacterium RIFOXYB2_FULL_37_13]